MSAAQMRTICGTFLAAVVAVGAVVAEVPKTVNGQVELVKAEEVHVRKGAGNFLAKMNSVGTGPAKAL